MEKIREFQKDYRWLSNFQECAILDIDQNIGFNIVYPSTEHAYQISKVSLEDKVLLLESGYLKLRANEVKKLSRSFNMRPDWDDVKLTVMLAVTREKYNHPSNHALRQRLLQTMYPPKDILTQDYIDDPNNFLYLEEGNNWNDTFWGISHKTGKGSNHLGRIVMQVRNEILTQINPQLDTPKWQTWSYELSALDQLKPNFDSETIPLYERIDKL